MLVIPGATIVFGDFWYVFLVSLKHAVIIEMSTPSEQSSENSSTTQEFPGFTIVIIKLS